MSSSNTNLISKAEEQPLKVETFQMPRFDFTVNQPEVRDFIFTSFSLSEQLSPDHQSENLDPRQKANQILQTAQDQAALIEREAQEKGYVQGEKDGREAAEKSLASIISHFQHLVIELESQKQQLYIQREQDLVHLVMIVARKIIDGEVSLRPELISQVLQTASHHLSETDGVRLRLNPQDHEWLEQHPEHWRQQYSALKSVSLIPDCKVSAGGLILENLAGEIDLTLESRWEAVSRVVEEGLNHARSTDQEP